MLFLHPSKSHSNFFTLVLQEWSEADYPPYANGPGYIISSDIAHYIVSNFEQHKLRVSYIFPLSNPSSHFFVSSFSVKNARRRLINEQYTKEKNRKTPPFNNYRTCSCSRWKMWAWECGYSNSTVLGMWRTCTAWNSVNLGALRVTTPHIINPRGKWSACGQNCKADEKLIAATWDDNG